MKPKLSTILLLMFTFEAHESLGLFSEPLQNLAIVEDQHQFHMTNKALIPKVSLTQKGYIQFLKYVVDVPELTDYSFCIWVRSNNLTHNHPLISYSKNEEKRLIRVWITSGGSHINLELLGVLIFSTPVNFLENHWYHVCQSWSSFYASWSLYLNGKLAASGHAPKLKDVEIDSGGDIVVGQEYTDFDKGLDDGIEGDISGFNFVLASTLPKNNLYDHPYNLKKIFKRETKTVKNLLNDPFFTKEEAMEPKEKSTKKRQIWDESLDFFSKHKLVPPLPLDYHNDPQYKPHQQIVPLIHQEPLLTNEPSLKNYVSKPLGLFLVELGFNCGYLRGAPLSGKDVLINWTKTEVRVFGGAILKTVPPFCDVR